MAATSTSTSANTKNVEIFRTGGRFCPTARALEDACRKAGLSYRRSHNSFWASPEDAAAVSALFNKIVDARRARGL